MKETQFSFWVGKIHWRRDKLPTPIFLGFPGSSVGKESAFNEGDPSSIPGFGRPAGEGKGYTFQYSWASLVVQLGQQQLGKEVKLTLFAGDMIVYISTVQSLSCVRLFATP